MIRINSQENNHCNFLYDDMVVYEDMVVYKDVMVCEDIVVYENVAYVRTRWYI